MVHFALLLLLAQAFLHRGGVMPQERVDFYHAVLKASGMATFPETEEEVVAALLKAYEKTKLAKTQNALIRPGALDRPASRSTILGFCSTESF